MPVKQIDGVLVSEWEGKYIDKSGFLKEDILGLNQLDKFSSMLDLIKRDSGQEIQLSRIPFDDPEVFKYFKRGWNEDIFQFGTTGLMNYCRQVKPTSMDDLIAMTALFRPGPMDVNAHGDFADIKAGKKKPSYDIGMEDITRDTYSLYVYQEQIMKAVIVGGLSAVQSDELRTCIKKKDHAKLESFGDKFKAGYAKLVAAEGVKDPDAYAAKVWEKLLAFSGYGFNKSHAAAYTIMSYWSQWFKVNYPLEFWTTALQYSKESEVPYRLAELKKTGVEIEVRPPDINFSGTNFTCDPKEGRIFFSLQKIKGVGDVAVQNLVDTRNAGGQFFSLEEFISRVPSKVNKTVVKSLIISGAFDLVEGLQSPSDRRRLLKSYLESKGDTLPEEYATEDAATNAFWILEQKRLTGFGDVDYQSMIRESIPNKRIAGLYVNDTEFLATPEGKQVAVAGKLIYYQTKDIKNGRMCTLQIDCNNTIISILLWPDAYEALSESVEDLKGCTVAISGIVKKDKFKNEKKIYSDSHTRLYVINTHKSKATKYEDWLASKQ
jgi:DNA polymerase-3 subunit alpha